MKMRFIIRLYKMIRKIVIHNHNLLSIYVSLLIGAMCNDFIRILRLKVPKLYHTSLGVSVCTSNPAQIVASQRTCKTKSDVQQQADEWYKKNALSLTQKHGEHGHSSLHHRLYPKKKKIIPQ
jgi:hypothetical protein